MVHDAWVAWRVLARCRMASGVETENRRIQRLSRLHRIEIFAEEGDFAAGRPQEHHIRLAVGTPRSLDPPFRLDFGNGRVRIGEGMHVEVEEAERFHRPQEPGNVTHHLVSPREPGRVAEGGRVGKFPHEVIGDQRLPLRVVRDEGLDMSVQELEAIVIEVSSVPFGCRSGLNPDRADMGARVTSLSRTRRRRPFLFHDSYPHIARPGTINL